MNILFFYFNRKHTPALLLCSYDQDHPPGEWCIFGEQLDSPFYIFHVSLEGRRARGVAMQGT
jgi:hypothetical protein